MKNCINMLSCNINIEFLKDKLGNLIENILIYDNTSNYEFYLDINSLLQSNTTNPKGLLIWEAKKYYKVELLPNNIDSSKIHIFVIPEFFNTDISFYREYVFTLSIMLLTRISNFDIYGVENVNITDYIVNKFKNEFKNQVKIYNYFIKSISISKPDVDALYPDYLKRTILIRIVKAFCGSY